jgi:apolipoprotein N-acyltransferase
MLDTARRLLKFEMTIAEWLGTAILLGVPYLVVGVIWALLHVDHLSGMHGVEFVVAFLGSVASWPALLLPNVCMA